MNQRLRAAAIRIFVAALATTAVCAASALAVDGPGTAVLQASGVQGGIIVLLGCDDPDLAVRLHANNSYIVQALDTDPAPVAAVRKAARSHGLYGKVSADTYDGRHLPYIDNSVNLIVQAGPCHVTAEEIARALAPGGSACTPRPDGSWRVIRKPRPADIDDWTHYLHDPSNNAVAHDRVVAPPARYQWIAGDLYGRHHDHISSVNALVAANGRVFTIFDEAPRASILIPAQWRLIARDAFNGVDLWKRPVEPWVNGLWTYKAGPQTMPRRLVAVGDRVYVTLGLDKPVSALDAATGKTIRTYQGTAATEEILYRDGVLFLVVAPADQPPRGDLTKRFRTIADIKPAAMEPTWTQDTRTVMAVNADAGTILWQRKSVIVPMSLAADGKHVVFHDGTRLVCLDRATGKDAWQSAPLARGDNMKSSAGVTVVLADDVVLYGGRAAATGPNIAQWSTLVYGVSASDGKTLWQAVHPPDGLNTPPDILVANGLAWWAEVAAKKSSGVVTGRDIHTGKVKSQFAPDSHLWWFHHRCYRAKATNRYLLYSRTGVEFVDYVAKHWMPNHWVRGACLYGIMPANGLLYAPQHPCTCYSESKLSGFSVLAGPARRPTMPTPDDTRLQKGEAYHASPAACAEPTNNDWPTYRHDAARTGATASGVPATGLKRAWRTELTGKLTPPVLAERKLFVAEKNAHTVFALDPESGSPLWHFTAGARVDSPPTIWHGRVLFGCRDGYVYCLRATDGKLAWRYLAATADRRMGAFGQVESVWPVSGSVLVENDTLYCVAGRSMFVDGGLRMIRLDPRTGRQLSVNVMDANDPATGKSLQTHMQTQNMPTALPDVLSSDGKYVYMRSLPFTMDGKRKYVGYIPLGERNGDDRHLFSPNGFLDDTMWHRTYWVWGRTFYSGATAYYKPGQVLPTGRLMVIDGDTLYGFNRQWRYFRWTSPMEFCIFRARKNAPVVEAPATSDERRANEKLAGIYMPPPQDRVKLTWSDNATLQATAMVLAGKTLFLAGPPDVVDELRASRTLNDPATRKALAEQKAAFQGLRGGVLQAVSPDTGKVLADYRLENPPNFDSLIAANGKLYMTTMDGHVVCLAASAKMSSISPSSAPVVVSGGQR